MQTFESIDGDLNPAQPGDFEAMALDLFRAQALECPIYRQYLTYLGVAPLQITTVQDIPFLPISLFKHHLVMTGQWMPEVIYTSSGTTGAEVSRHAVSSVAGYLHHARRTFELFYGPLNEFHVLCLLPSYLERTGSSLVAMANDFIVASGSPHSGFYLKDLDALASKLESLRDGRKVLLLGVTFALLDLAEQFELDLRHCVVMETGGMKGRRPEITREELHGILTRSFNVPAIHSEYGMTELLSQAYSAGAGLFKCSPTMRVLLREIDDPFSPEYRGTGVIRVIDLANHHSCAFIESQDLGRVHENGDFEVLGRMDNSDLRGCNLLVG
ncbi:MAG: acyl transferase [Cyclobacteriaceae bacterium]|nr:acyl transferase [Cyclobacteriaceae bacterium]